MDVPSTIPSTAPCFPRLLHAAVEIPKTAYSLPEYPTVLRQRRIFGQFYLQFETPILRAAMYLIDWGDT